MPYKLLSHPCCKLLKPVPFFEREHFGSVRMLPNDWLVI